MSAEKLAEAQKVADEAAAAAKDAEAILALDPQDAVAIQAAKDAAEFLDEANRLIADAVKDEPKAQVVENRVFTVSRDFKDWVGHVLVQFRAGNKIDGSTGEALHAKGAPIKPDEPAEPAAVQ